MENNFQPLVPRSPKEDMLNLSLDEYHKKLEAQNPFIKSLGPVPGETAREKQLGDQLQYLIDTVSDMNIKKNEIKQLCELCNAVIVEELESDIINFNVSYIYPLISIAGEANFNDKEKSDIEVALSSAVDQYFEKLFSSKSSIVYKAKELINWNEYQIVYLNYFGVGFPYNKPSVLKRTIERNDEQIEILKALSPRTYIVLIQIFKNSYQQIPQDYQAKFREFYLNSILQQIIVSRNYGYYDYYEQLLEDYYSEKLRNKRLLNWSFKYLIGYGEKPWRLLSLFFGVNLIFTLLFTFSHFEFNFTKNVNGFERFITFFSFDTTTMLTVGYGDVYPLGIGARLAVIILQLLGFIISASAITLFIRKLLRF